MPARFNKKELTLSVECDTLGCGVNVTIDALDAYEFVELKAHRKIKKQKLKNHYKTI